MGEEDPDLAESYGKEAKKLGAIIASTVGLIFFIFAPRLVSLYNKDPVVVQNAALALRIIGVMQPLQSSQLVLAGALRGAGDTVSTFIATLISLLIIRVSFAHLFVNVLGYGIAGAWSAVVIDQFVRWVVVRRRFDRGKWKELKLHA